MTAQGAEAADVQHRSLEMRAGDGDTASRSPHGTLADVSCAEISRRVRSAASASRRPEHAQRRDAPRRGVAAGEAGAAFAAAAAPDAAAQCTPWFDGWREVPLVARDSLAAGAAWPARRSSSSRTRRSWSNAAGRPSAQDDGTLLLARVGRLRARPSTGADPARSSSSTTVSCTWPSRWARAGGDRAVGQHPERLDFSCALFDAEGGLVANAPHMPVHLGSMGASVRAVIAAHAAAAAAAAPGC